MKKFVYGLFAAFAAAGCTSHSGYVLTGQVPEAWEGKPVMLMLSDTGAPQTIDSTLVADGAFRFKGTFELPRQCQVVVFLDPENRQDPDLLVAFPVFLDSTAVAAVCDNSGKKPVFTLSGGATQTEYDEYTQAVEALRRDRKKSFYEYTDAFYKQEDTHKAVSLAGVVDEKAQKIRDFQTRYIHQHPASAVSLRILTGLCEPYSVLSPEQMNGLFASLAPRLQESEMGRALQQTIAGRKVVLGAPYPDLELKDESGRTVKISDLVKPGHYTLLELWASWCSPCRSEIPFIKQTYAKYHPKGFDVLSISIDKSEADWKRALKEEKLPWPQLLDDSRQSFVAYETSAVPTSLLIDPQGRICDLNARGGWLDKALQEIYGTK